MRDAKKLCLVAIAAMSMAACGEDDGVEPEQPDSGNGLISITGTVLNRQDVPLQGLAVEVVGGSSSTTSSATGQFTLSVPAGEHFIQATGEGHWGGIKRIDASPTSSLVNLQVFADAEVSGVDLALDDRTFDETLGIVIVEFPGDTSGGRGATLDVDSDLPFTFDGTNMPVPSAETLVPGNELLFTNVSIGTVSVILAGTTASECEIDGSEYPVAARTVTIVRAFCASSARSE